MGRRRVARVAVYSLCAMALLVLAGYAALRFVDFSSTVRPVVVQRIEALTGRNVAVTGDFELVLSLAPTVVARGVALSNASWASDVPMLRADRVEVTLQLLPLLLDGDVIVDRLALSDADILLETGPDGRANWRSDTGNVADEGPGTERARLILFDDVALRDTRVTWYDGVSNRRTTVRIDQFGWLADGPDDALTLAGNGRVGKHPFRVAGRLGPLSLLAAGKGPYPVALAGSLAEVELSVEGDVGFADAPSDMAVTISGESLDALGRLAGTALPPLGPYRADGRLKGVPDGFAIEGLTAAAGTRETVLVSIAGGEVAGLPSNPSLDDLAVTAEGGSLAMLGALAGADLPAIGPFRLAARASGPVGAPALHDLSGTAGGEKALVRLDDGSIGALFDFDDVRLPLTAEAVSLDRLAAPFGAEFGDFGPVTAEGVLISRGDGLALEGLTATVGGAAAALQVRGTVADPSALAGLDLAVAMEGTDLGALEPLVGFPLPRSEPFRLEGRVAGSVREFGIDPLEAGVAGSVITGRLAVAVPDGSPPVVEGRLAADRLDVDRLTALAEAGNEVAAAGDGDEGGEDEAIPVDWLDELTVSLDVSAGRLAAGKAEFGRMSAGISIADGKLAIRDLTLRTAGGALHADAEVEAAAETAPGPTLADVTLRMTAEDVPLTELVRGMGAEIPASGQIDIDLAIDGTGRTVDQILADLEGGATVTADEGSIKGTQMNYLVPDLDLLRILPFFRSRADRIRVNCMVGRFDIDDGVARTDALLDTARMTLLGKGTVDLASEELDLALSPVPKSRKLSAASVPVDVRGSISSPDIRLRGEAPGRILGGLLGGLLVPLNQIAAMFGRETADACADALGQARGREAGQ